MENKQKLIHQNDGKYIINGEKTIYCILGNVKH